MEESSYSEFPGFQTYNAHKEDIVLKRCLSRLQRRAPCPLQLMKPNHDHVPSSFHGTQKPLGSSLNPSSSTSSSSFDRSKDPIPLLSPLVLPSLLESACIQQENVTKSLWLLWWMWTCIVVVDLFLHHTAFGYVNVRILCFLYLPLDFHFPDYMYKVLSRFDFLWHFTLLFFFLVYLKFYSTCFCEKTQDVFVCHNLV